MKRFCALLVSVCILLTLTLGCFVGCDTSKKDGFTVVCSIFPIYDWVRSIVGESDNVTIVLLLDQGIDLHSYQPTVADMVTITTSDLFIYVGGESDTWAEDITKQNPDLTALSLMELMGDSVKEEETVEGMSSSGEEEEEETAYDEHVWLSLKNAVKLTKSICDSLSKMNSSAKDIYETHLASYTEQLNELDKKFETMVSTSELHTILFGDRFPFRYLADDYYLSYYAAFLGCSAESEASFETIAVLADKLRNLNLQAVLVLEGTNHDLAETIIETAECPDTPILEMNSMQSVTKEDVDAGATYLSYMEQNYRVLSQALNRGR